MQSYVGVSIDLVLPACKVSWPSARIPRPLSREEIPGGNLGSFRNPLERGADGVGPDTRHNLEFIDELNSAQPHRAVFSKLKHFRRIATRYDKLANSFLDMVRLATARYWLKFVHAV